MNISQVQQSTFPARSNGAVPAFVQRSISWARVALTAGWRHVTVTDLELQKAKEALRHAQRALLVAEDRFDSDRSVNSKPLISRIKVAEAQVEASRAALRRIDPWCTE